MRSTIFRQYDSRWGSLAYPTSAYTFAKNGCGCCACTHLVIEKEAYKKYTPKTLRKYMVRKGYATKGYGTTHTGIKATLEHYGYSVKHPDNMSDAWKELNKGNRGGILLFKAGSRGGVTWTSGGHYVAFTNYKVKNGKHYFYTKDSGARKNDGWHCYETHMMGLIKQIWIVTLPSTYTVGETYTLQYNMNVRTGAGTGYKKVTVLKKGTKVKCLEVSENGRWMRTAKGWICCTDSSYTYIK